MPFILKNAKATYQQLLNLMFKDHIGKTMEVYIDGILVKSEKAKNHLNHHNKTFDILEKYKMQLNLTNCAFGVLVEKFFEHLVTQKRIEKNPDQIRALIDMPSPRIKKDVQRLNGRVAALSRFILRSSNKWHEFFKILKRRMSFEWMDECEKVICELKIYLG